MMDYSELLLNIQKDHRRCYEALLKRDWEKAAYFADAIQLQAAALESFCKERESNERNVG
jgi:hypothetical protein